jgi:hypothetical protein
MLEAESGHYLDLADQELRRNELFLADRFAAAADAFVHAVEHSEGLQDGPRGPRPDPSSPGVAEHLQRVYFHLQQADYFAKLSGRAEAEPLRQVARRFYEQALRAYDNSDWPGADDFAKTADDTIRGLENLTQAGTPLPPRPR